MADLTLNTASKEIKKSSNKVSQTYVIKKRTESKHPAVQSSCPDKNALPSTEQLLLTLMEEVKGIKNQILIPSDTSSLVSQACSSKTPKQKVWYGPCKHCGMRNHLFDDCYSKPKCYTCGSTSHTTKEHTEQTAHEIADCPKNLRNSRKPRVAIKQSEATEKYSKEPSPKVVFRDDSSGDTKGYGLVNCNGITFTRVAYLNECRLHYVFYQKDGKPNEVRVKELRSDNGTEFRNHKLEEFCDEKGISQNFSSPCTPEQNGIAERRNRTLIEAARTMLNSAKLPKQLWGKAPVHIDNHRDHLGKFDEKADDGFFLGYSSVAKTSRVFNIRRKEMEETVHVTFSEDDEAISQSSTEGDAINFNENRSFPDDEFIEPRSKDTQCSVNIEYFLQESVISKDPPEFTEVDNHPTINEPNQAESADHLDSVESQNNVIIKPIKKHIKLVNIIGEPRDGITTRSRIRDSDAASAFECLYVNFLSEIEPKKLIEALEEEG
ncbi:retrovirus-related pol polyprotein from transposon TNT 1-94 [Tanacetum coccineum]